VAREARNPFRSTTLQTGTLSRPTAVDGWRERLARSVLSVEAEVSLGDRDTQAEEVVNG
jgi:hypothetical protein